MRACRCCSLELVLKTSYGAMALCCAPVVSDACEPLRGSRFSSYRRDRRSVHGGTARAGGGPRECSRTIPRTYIREPTDPLGTSARVSNIGFAATMEHGPVHRSSAPVPARPRSTRARARPTSDRARLCRPAGRGPPSKRTSRATDRAPTNGGRVTYTRCTARRETPNEPRRDIKRAIRGWIRQRQQRKCRPTPPDRPAIPRDLLAFLPICSHLGQGLLRNHVNRVSVQWWRRRPIGW